MKRLNCVQSLLAVFRFISRWEGSVIMLLKRCILFTLLIFILSFMLPTDVSYGENEYISVESDIFEDTVWDNSGQIYRLESNVSIKQDAKLILGEGVTVEGNGNSIIIYGELHITSSTLLDVSIETGNTGMNAHASFVMENSSFSRGGLFTPSGSPGHAHIEMRDNRITDTKEYTYIWYPTDVTYITGNTFTNCGSLSVGSDYDVYITNNTFHGYADNGIGAIIENWTQYNGSHCYVRFNNFDYTGTVLKLPSGYSSANMIADHNYWYTDKEEEISARIFDYNDDFGCAGTIIFFQRWTN